MRATDARARPRARSPRGDAHRRRHGADHALADDASRSRRRSDLRARREPKANAAALAELAKWYAEGKVKPVIDRRLPMRELPVAYERMGSRTVRGKLVMTND